MKKIIALIIFLVPLVLMAQIPNNGFENWTSMGSYDTPDGWGNLNSMTSASGLYTCTKGIPGNPGSFYLKLTSRNISGSGLVPGIAVCGTLSSTGIPASGIPYTLRPAKLEGKWQFMAYGEDQGYIAILLSKWNSVQGTRDTIAWSYYALPGMVMSWRNFSIPLTYVSGETPDSVMIIASASNANGAATAEPSYLYLDDLTFTDTVAGIEEGKRSMTISVFPNPATDHIKITKSVDIPEEAAVYNSEGKEILRFSISSEKNLDIRNLSSGIYFIRIMGRESASSVNFIRK